MSKNEITINEDSFVDRQIVSGDVFMVQSMDGNELQYDKLSATLDVSGFKPTHFKPRNAGGLLTTENELLGVRPRISILVVDAEQYKPGAVVLYKHNGTLVGKYYMDTLEKTGKASYKINCISPVGVLSKTKHYGGVYNGILFRDLVNEIVGDVVPCTVGNDVANQPVYGWLPVASRRDNLHQALFAMGAAAQKDSNGDLYIAPLFNDAYIDISNDRIYSGGKLKYSHPAAKTSVSEHSFFASDTGESKVLFDGAVAAEEIETPQGKKENGSIVLFDEPMHSLVISGGSIIESGANYAVLAPAGSCVLSGKKYTHTVREVSVNGGVASGQNVAVENATLVSTINSENVVQRVALYRAAAKTLNLSVVVENERAGSSVQVSDPFGNLTRGIVSSVDISMSNKLKGDIEVVTDYSPGSAGNFYENLAVITEDGTWTVPTGVSKIRVVLIGGGDGGKCGNPGFDGNKGPTYTSALAAYSAGVFYGTSGAGGAGGLGGSAGKVYIASLDVAAGTLFNITIGEGGAGASFEEFPGVGTASMFGDLSSDNGSSAGTGYASLMGGEIFALPGTAGKAGGAGQSTNKARPAVEYNNNTWTAGRAGEDGYGGLNALSYGGLGGGASVGFDGEDGQSGISGDNFAIGGNGGAGSEPQKAVDAVVRGSGGGGGHGGGGGGGAGCSIASSSLAGAGGRGGNGGQGGNGAPGVVLIYY